MTKQLNILMLEDSPDDAYLIQRELKAANINFEARIVSNKRDFENALNEFTPDLILSDFSMPTFDGLSALKIFKSTGSVIPFVFVSGTIGEERAIEAIKNGATDYILKDHLSGLVPKVRRALQEAKERLEKIEAEKKLIRSQMQLAEAQKVAHIGNWELELDSNQLIWSEEMFRIFGFDSENTFPSPDLFDSCIHPHDKELISEFRNKHFHKHKPYEYTTRIIRNDTGEVRHVYVKADFKTENETKKEKAFGIIQDVTELMEAERKLEQANKELKTFIYKATHDIRGPLCSARGLLDLANSVIASDPSDFQKYFGMMQQSLNKLDSIISTLVEVLSIKEVEIQTEQVDFNVLLQESLEKLKTMEGISNINFNISVSSGNFNSDATFVKSIFYNLIHNSIKFQSSSKPPHININVSSSQQGVDIEISDNGSGIEKEVIPHVFNMFYRGNLESKGSGLGLYIVKMAVERLNGSIDINSTFGNGCKVKIFLPNRSLA